LLYKKQRRVVTAAVPLIIHRMNATNRKSG
jgi:hypothetical protein